MKEFLKENIAIIAAIVLPLLLVVIFMMSTTVTRLAVDDPKHDFLLATDYYRGDQSALSFDVIQESLVVTYRYPAKDGNRNIYHRIPRLWRVHVSDMSVEEISIPVPDAKPADESTVSIKLDIADLSGLKLVNRQPGPDGYEFDPYSRRYRGNLMTELFSYDSYYTGASISKSGRTIQIKGQRENQYRYNTEFIGWILNQE